MRNPAFCKCENKDADQLRGAFVFATQIQLLKAYRIKFQKFAAHAHKDDLIKETFKPTYSQFSSLSTELSFIFYRACGHSHWSVTVYV